MTTQVSPQAPTLPELGPYVSRHGVDTSQVPFRLEDGVHVPVERYYDQNFSDLEYTKMWLHTWQFAAREESIRRPGDYIEYTIVDRTVIIVRQKDNSIKVLENVCPHRATQLVEPGSCGAFGGNQIVCPFHGWQFNIDGSQSYIYARHGFIPESIDPARLGLKEVRSAVKYGFVWINFDDDAPSIDEFFGSYDTHIAPICMDRMRLRWWRYSIVPANWKITIEAFMESYHVMQSHPDLAGAAGAQGDDFRVDPVKYFYHGMGHVDSTPPYDHTLGFNMPEPFVEGIPFGRAFLEGNRVMFEGTDATNTLRDEYIADRVRDLPDDEVMPRFFEELYKYAAEAKIPLAPLDFNASNYGYIFPNMVFLGFAVGNILFYRARPNGNDPNSSIFEAFALQMPREADMDNPSPLPEGPLNNEEWPFILRQDMENVGRMQNGYRSGGIRNLTLSPRWETMIFSLHDELDRYIATY